MSLYINAAGVDYPLTAHLEEDGSGITLSGKEQEIEIFIAFPLDYPRRFSKINFELHLLFKREVRENEIHEVYSCQGKRMGWIFPIQSLQSDKHSHVEDLNFLVFARIATELLLDGFPGVFLKVPKYDPGHVYSLSDFYSDQTVLMLLSRSNSEVQSGFDLTSYLPYLALHGFYGQSARDPYDGVLEKEIKAKEDGSRLRLRSLSSDLRVEPFISTLMMEILPYERQALSKFFFLYQLVELLIDRVLQESHKALAKDLLAAANGTGSNFKDLLDVFNEKLSEKKRINVLISSYIAKRPDESSLRTLCGSFLRQLGIVNADGSDFINFSEYLYKVRNILFHNFRMVDKNAAQVIEPICNEFKIVLLELLIEFRIPAALDQPVVPIGVPKSTAAVVTEVQADISVA
jgi:hypothetical protein